MSTYMPPLSEPSSTSKMDFKEAAASHVSVQMRASMFQSPARGLTEKTPNRSSLIGRPSSTQKRSLAFTSPSKAPASPQTAAEGDQENVRPSSLTPLKARTPLKATAPASPKSPTQPKTSPFRVRNEGHMGQSVYKLVKDLKDSALERGDTRAAERLRAIQAKVAYSEVDKNNAPVTVTPVAPAATTPCAVGVSEGCAERGADLAKAESGLFFSPVPVSPGGSAALPASASANQAPAAVQADNDVAVMPCMQSECVVMESDIVVMPALQRDLGVMSPVEGASDVGLARMASEELEGSPDGEDSSSDGEEEADRAQEGAGKENYKAAKELFEALQRGPGASGKKGEAAQEASRVDQELEMTVEGGDGLEATEIGGEGLEATEMTVEGGDGLEGGDQADSAQPAAEAEQAQEEEVVGILSPSMLQPALTPARDQKELLSVTRELVSPPARPLPATPQQAATPAKEASAAPEDASACLSPQVGYMNISSTNAVNNSTHVLLASEQTPLKYFPTPTHNNPTPTQVLSLKNVTPTIAAASPFKTFQAALAKEALEAQVPEPAQAPSAESNMLEKEVEQLRSACMSMQQMQEEMTKRYKELEGRYETLKGESVGNVTVDKYIKLQRELDQVKLGLERVETEPRHGSGLHSPRRKDCKCVIS